MTSNNKRTDDLGQLYQKRKSKVRTSTSEKRLLMSHEVFTPPWKKWFHRSGQVAIAASTLLLIVLVAFQHYSLNNHLPQQQYTLVEIHSLDEKEGPLSENVRHKYAQHYQAYLKQKQMFAKHHKKSAIIQQLDDGWELKTCDEEIVRISNELINALYDLNSIETSLRAGDQVEIAFDRTGIILSIDRSNSATMC